jgi:hypothetical protein
MPEDHSCDFNYKSLGVEELKKANPQIVADKIERI